MNCYHHQDINAVGFCKSCCKSLCADCAVEVDDVGIACRSHIERIKLIEELLNQSLRVKKINSSKLKFMTPLFLIVLGCLFSGAPVYGMLVQNPYDIYDIMQFLIGFVFVLLGVYSAFMGMKAFPSDTKEQSTK
jgi:hypothetical protein